MPRARRHQWSADGQEEAPRPSRSARKRASLALQDLGAELARLPLPEMRALNLPPDLAAALELYARIGDHEGRRRQLQFIGRLMREVDPEPVRAALEARQAKTAAAGAALHLAEQWRHRLLAAPEAELDSLLGALPAGAEATGGDDPAADAAAKARAELRALALEARREKAANAAPHAARALFRALRRRFDMVRDEKIF
ncbi:ribosome biogenesis factor YjgA [Desulfovibrio legallii]|uniref:Ribosome-associated protein n=1 Tax=Desulfovibrio legallii TaxID=571438 RepID=A0A1G7PJ06_9BACT|nr:ribosome biogenesis factor YjgA [Desulfovibrio legallii]SDF86221.1 ribosome-associated protein [Desulfovibrio legallii]